MSFWLFLAVVIGSLIWRKTLLQRETLATLRAAIERDLPLEDKRMRALFDAAGMRVRQPVSPDFFLVLGTLSGAAGMCLFALALFVPKPEAFVVLGISAGVLSGSLLLLWRFFSQRASVSDDTSIPS